MKQETNVPVLLFAAGFGKRLRELTASTPKPLLEVGGKKLIEWNLEMIAREGFCEVFINLHHLSEQIRQFVGDGRKWGLTVHFLEEVEILDTGGAIKNVEPLLEGDTLLTVNSDILLGEEFSLQAVLKEHRENPRCPLATLVLRPDTRAALFGELGIDREMRITSFLGTDYVKGTVRRGLVYIGVQALSRKIFEFMPPRGAVFSITKDTYINALKKKTLLHSFLYEGYWNDVGTPERLTEVRQVFH